MPPIAIETAPAPPSVGENAAIRRPVMRYHGGKFRLAPRLLEIFPPHRVYTEAFGGGASVLLLKPRCYSEIYNDLDGEVVNVFRVLQNPRKAKRLRRLLQVTPFARAEFELSYRHSRSDVERARRTLIRSFMGFGSDSISRTKASRAGFNTRISSTMATGFRWNSNRSGTTAATDWRSYPHHIDAFVARLQGVTIENRDALEILAKIDRADALHYVDPPYPHSVRREGNGSTPEHRYRWEMTDADHKRLAKLLRSLRGMVIVSSYPGPLYERLYRGWRQMWWTSGQFVSSNNVHMAGSAEQRRTECVWLNEAAWRNSQHRLLFD
jgi:DNA adenine methylase